MNKEKNKRVGCTVKVQLRQQTSSGKYFHLTLPRNTCRSLDLEHKDIVKVEMRTMDKEEQVFTTKVYETGDLFKVNVPKPVSDQLGLSDGVLVDLFLEKKE